MKKILLIGKYNTITKSLNQILSKYFKVETVSDNIEVVQGMLKMGSYDLIVLDMVGWEQEKTAIFKEVEQKSSKIPVICIVQEMEVPLVQEYFPVDMVHVIKLPDKKKNLLDTVCMLLDVQVEYEPEVQKEIGLEIAEGAEKCKKRILVIDDSTIQLRLLREVLKEKYEVLVASSGDAAMAVVSKKIPDLIFLDYEMPVCNGKMVFEKLRNQEETKNIPIVFLTGEEDEENIQDILRLNPEGYLFKPVKHERMMETIDRIIGE